MYDIQENYYRNIRWTRAFPRSVRGLLAWWVRLRERLLIPFFHRVIVAEKCYLDEMPFLPETTVVIENKSVLPEGFVRQPAQDKLLLAFTGTLSETTGVYRAIDLVDQLYEKRADVELHIIGSCAQPAVLADIMSRCSGKSYIRLVAGKMQVGHERILDLIGRAHFGIVSYPASPHTAGRIPTKLFEYMSARLPILLQNNPAWVELTAPLSAAILTDFHNPDIDGLLRDMSDQTFYTGPVEGFLWKSEEKKLIDLVGTL